MIKRVLVAILGAFIGLSLFGCQKEENSLLVGTSWECREDGSILVFNDNQYGLYYCKSATDDVYDEIFSSFDFDYDLSGKNLTIQVSSTRRTFVMDGIIDGDLFTTNGTLIQRHYVKIPHKLPD